MTEKFTPRFPGTLKQKPGEYKKGRGIVQASTEMLHRLLSRREEGNEAVKGGHEVVIYRHSDSAYPADEDSLLIDPMKPIDRANQRRPDLTDKGRALAHDAAGAYFKKLAARRNRARVTILSGDLAREQETAEIFMTEAQAAGFHAEYAEDVKPVLAARAEKYVVVPPYAPLLQEIFLPDSMRFPTNWSVIESKFPGLREKYTAVRKDLGIDVGNATWAENFRLFAPWIAKEFPADKYPGFDVKTAAQIHAQRFQPLMRLARRILTALQKGATDNVDQVMIVIAHADLVGDVLREYFHDSSFEHCESLKFSLSPDGSLLMTRTRDGKTIVLIGKDEGKS